DAAETCVSGEGAGAGAGAVGGIGVGGARQNGAPRSNRRHYCGGRRNRPKMSVLWGWRNLEQ
ncbi:MAG: hypothetical protein QMB70_10370, partial [Aeromonadaceae bacterium]